MRLERVIEIVDALVDSGTPIWVGGGWGIDALIGRQTRPHDDLDIAIRTEDEERALALLIEMGFEVVEAQDWRPVRVALRNSRGEEIDLHPVAFDDNGVGLQANLEGLPPFEYPPEQLVEGRLNGHVVPCIGPELQLRFHTDYEATDKDQSDVQLLCEHLGMEPPPNYRGQRWA